MARTLYMNDGTMELVLDNPQDTLQKIIYERLGRDCEELFMEIIEELTGSDGDDWEKIADGYHGKLMDTVNDLGEALAKPRLDRKRIEAIHRDLYKNL